MSRTGTRGGLCLGCPFVVTVLVWMWVHAPPAFAADGGTLAAAVEAAVRRHPQGALAGLRSRVGDGYLRQSASLLAGDPSGEIVYRSDRILDDLGYREFEAALTLPLWQPGQRAARRALGERTRDLAEAEAAWLRWQLWQAVLERYWPLRRAAAGLEMARVQERSAQALLAAVERRVQAGELPRSELLLARQELLERQSAVSDAEARLDQARVAWRSLTGLESWPERVQVERAAVDSAIPSHPRLRLAEAALERAAAQYEDTRRRRRAAPELTLYGKHDRGFRDDPWDSSVGVGLRVPFGTAAPAAPAEAEAAYHRARAEADLAEARREVELQVERARREILRAQKALQLAVRQAALGRERLRMNVRAFELGESGLFLLLQARAKAAEAERVLENSRIDLDKAVLAFNLAVGALP